jgi:heme-degrading monooxygenase HmoA
MALYDDPETVPKESAARSSILPRDLPAGAIARTWHGTTSTVKADAYLELMRTVALPDYRSTPGNLCAFTLVRRESDAVHFLMVTFWESEKAIAAFAGKPIEVAKFYDFDDNFLVVKEPTATHYELYDR